MSIIRTHTHKAHTLEAVFIQRVHSAQSFISVHLPSQTTTNGFLTVYVPISMMRSTDIKVSPLFNQCFGRFYFIHGKFHTSYMKFFGFVGLITNRAHQSSRLSCQVISANCHFRWRKVFHCSPAPLRFISEKVWVSGGVL